MRNLRTAENQAAHFEARLIPVGDTRLKVEWLRNGVPIEASNRVTTMHDFGYVALNMKYVYPEDSGTYTCRAVNDLGEAVTSATLDVQSKESLLLDTHHEGALQKIYALEDSSRYQRREETETVVTQAPKFVVPLNGPSELVEGHSAHYECRIEPYPDSNLKVEWFHNGKPLQSGHRFRTTYDFGFAALDILSVYGEDTGEYTCRATNLLGQATSSVKLNVKTRSSIILDSQHEGALQKIQYLEDESRYKRTTTEDVAIAEKPQFGRPLKSIEHLPEGLSAHLEATLTPVNDPTMKVEWFRNGRPIPQGHRFKTTYDFGFVALDVLYAYPEDSGTYMCKARNAVGEAVTTCSVTVDSKSGLQLDTLDEQRLKKIRDLESYEQPRKEEVEPIGQPPVFITPLNSLQGLKEGDHAHLECRVEPVNDPTMKIEWFVNGIAVRTGHRFRTTHDFGYVALDILYTWGEDSGTYMCKATNKLGEAVNTTTINVQSRRSVFLETQHPEGLEKIQALEAQGHASRLEIEEPLPTPPRFVTELRGTTELMEGQTAHFECQVEPLHDSSLRIEFYHNNKPLPSASRFHITFDFGYVALDIGHVVPEDAGEYSVRAINKLGQCVSSINLKVNAKSSIILDSQRPEGLEKIRQLESATPFQRPEVPEAVTRQRPVFTQPLQNIDFIAEGQTAHFECRLIPVGDPTLKVEWFRNEKPLETSSRITKTHDFGFVSMDMTHVRDEDNGVYMCRASNALGEAVTTASMKVKTKADIQLETMHSEGMKKIQQLEEGKAPIRPAEQERVFEKPIFTQLLTGPSELWEGQHAHFECRVVPVGDPTLRFEWFVNGIELKMGSRFRTTHDFGFVTLDIMSTVPEDSGVYMCKAINKAGEAVSSTSLKVKSKSAISGEPLQPDAWQKIQLKEAEMNKVPPSFIDTKPQQAPVFTTHLQSMDKLAEGQHVYLEAQVEPRTDPNLRIEWFKNGMSLTTGSRIRSTFDFGLVSLSINSLRNDDSAIYTCKATNLLGEAVSTCTLKIEDRHWLLANALRPEALPLIEALEAPKPVRPEIPDVTFEGPVFISHLNNVECKEGDNVHFECHVEPSKDPTLNIEWFVNGKPLPTGARFKSTYDFGYVSLDINHAYAEDSGVYSCKATNNKGQASTSGSLRCTGKSDIYLDTQHPQGQAGLEKVQEVEDAYASKYKRQISGPEAEFPKPIWTTPLGPEFSMGEATPLHLEATVEPKNDPNLKIEWFFNGKTLEHGSRFKMTNDFGFVTLDLTEVYERDQGIYTCKASNKAGEAFTSTTIYCTSKAGLIEKTQHPKGEAGLEKIQDLEESLQRQEQKPADVEAGQPPMFTSQFQNLSNMSEGEIAHFEASLVPVGDQTMVVEWFYNGKTLEASHRTRTVHAFGMVVMEILGTKIEDSGTYTCRATNKWGKAELSVTLECVDKSKGQKPQFTTHIQSIDGLKDGDSAHFECTLIPVGDPNMKVEWFHNGKPLRHSTRIKTVSDFGFVVMDIAYTQSHDTGEYICKASNKYGEDFTKATIRCVGKGGVYLDSLQPDSLARIHELESMHAGQAQVPTTPTSEPPRFITQIKDVTQLKEGQSAHFEARLTPVTDPNLVVEWYYNGKKLPHGHRYRTFHDFGIVILDILYCYEENSGEYECRAFNQHGQDSTKAVLKCVSKANLILESQLPQGMEGGLEKIQNLEDAMIRTKDETSIEERRQAPVFTVPLSNIESLREGESAHFEARLIPTDDPKLKVEWFWNGKPLRTGSRFRTFCDFGFVILEISPVYPEDSGEYSCRAFNDYGQAVTTATMKIQGKRSIILESQLPKGMEGTIEKIAELEGLGQAPAPLSPEADSGKPPEFITTPADLILAENQLAHFECRLIPINDPSMRVEWFHNGKALSAGSRVKTINDFGFVILEIAGCYIREAGLYTCKATNKHGEATVSCKLQIHGRQGIILEPQLPSNFRTGTESIQKLEETLYKREEIISEEEKPNPPRFIVELKDVEIQEACAAHFDCRVEPVGDSSMRIDWFFNGRPFATGSRVHMINDFGFIVLDMDYVYARDSGEYICRATNKWGTATTKAKLICKAKHDVVLESQLPQGMSGEKLKELERGPIEEAKPEDTTPQVPPKFITQIESVGVGEAEPVHFECRVEPRKDPKLRIEWYRNNKILPSGHRYKNLFDLGFVSLDILYVYPEDSGEYICRAVNEYGEDFTKATVSCKKIPAIILQSQVPKGMKKTDALMQMEAAIKKYTSEIHLTEDDLYEPEKKQPPRFVTQIKDQTELVEMQSTKFECQLAPVGDPNMKVEWFLNGKPLAYKNRFTPIYDFGYVAMNFGWVYPEDSGEYLCRATNLYGMDETKAIIKTAGKPGIIYDSQLPKGMKSIERIREMEAAWQVVPEEVIDDEKPKEAPVFVSKPEPFTVVEGGTARFCCRVTGFPRPRVMWLINGHTIVNGMRYKLTYDGMWHLDIPKTRQYDNGKIEVVARNSLGEARVETVLTVKPRGDDYRGVLKNSPRPWYDSELSQYQSERQEGELIKVFEDRSNQVHQTGYEIDAAHLKHKIIKEQEPEWTQTVKSKKHDEYYGKLRELEEEQLVKETRLREASHQFAIPGEKVTKGMVESYQANLEQKSEELLPWQNANLLKQAKREERQDINQEEELKPWQKANLLKQVKKEEVVKEETIEPWQKGVQLKQVKREDLQEVTQEEVKEPWQKGVQLKQVKREDIQEVVREEVKEPWQKGVQLKQVKKDDSQEINQQTKETWQKDVQLKQVKKEEVQDIVQEKEKQPWQKGNVLKQTKREDRENLIQEETTQKKIFGDKVLRKVDQRSTEQQIDQNSVQQKVTDQKYMKAPPEPLEASVHGKEVHVAKQKQTQKEVQGDTEITRKITATETTEVEHKGKIQERVVQGKVQPAKPPVFTKKIQPCRAFEQEQARFEVEFDGEPLPTIKWFRENFPIQNSPDFQIHTFSTKSILIIRQVFMEDSGVFAVIAENRGGTAKCSANLVVEERRQPGRGGIVPPSFTTTAQATAVKAGQLARFDAKIAGTKPMDVYWLKNGKKIMPDIRYKILEEDNTYTLLIIETIPEDSGQYECVAINSAGEARCEAECLVQAPAGKVAPKQTPASPTEQAPTVIQKLTDQTMKEGQPVTFKCKIAGKPVPQVTWQKGDKVIKPSKYFQMLKEGAETYVLRISEVFPEDEGTYKCVATNPGGKVLLSANLRVLAPETQEVGPTLAPMKDIIVPEGSTAQFKTQFAGKPAPTIQWLREGMLIPQSPDFQMINEGKNAILLIASTYEEDSGRFTCRATNSAGQTETSANLIVKSKN
uniref:Ig-like domain-containing protein n=2 Tax=Clastoptera arizonana TaxID=38151 RepID=A0A1B6D7W5_9HEMI